jgi:nucleoside-diphosphate-sugar epimerase
MAMRALVTGGAGFVGRYIVDALRQRDVDVTIFGRSDARVPLRPGVRHIAGDVRNPALVAAAARDVELVVHVAGNIRTPATDDPELHRAVNVAGTANVVAACVDNRVPRLVYVSTCEVYGENAGENVAEDAPKAPANAYAESKWLGEVECQKAAGERLRVTVVRPAYVFGYGQYEGRLFPRLVRMVSGTRRGGTVPLTPAPGGNDFVYVRDVAEGVVVVGTRQQGAALEVFNLGSGRYTPVREVFEAIRDLTGVGFAEPLPAGQVPTGSRFSLRMARAAAAGFVPRYSLRDGLSEFIALERQSPHVPSASS